MQPRPFMWILLGPVTAIVTAVAMMAMFVAFLGGLALTGAAITAFVKREDWTFPAYRWARDRTGRWRMTPWSSDGREPIQNASSMEA